MEGVGEDMENELEDDGQSELARMQKATLGDSDLAQYAITGNDKVRLTRNTACCNMGFESSKLRRQSCLCASAMTSSMDTVGSGVGSGSCRWKGERQCFSQSNWGFSQRQEETKGDP